MSETILVTGGTGLAGSNVALLALQRGKRVKALARGLNDQLNPLRRAGVEWVVGDVTDPASLDEAMKGVQGVVHTAAAIGGTWSKNTKDIFWAVNHVGTLNVFDAAQRAGVSRLVSVDTVGIYDPAFTLTERSPIALIEEINSPYVRAKRAAFYGGQYRASLGQDIRFVAPGAIFGPGPLVERAMDPTSFTSVLQRGITGEIESYLTFPMQFTYSLDLADLCLLALDRGEIGRRYLAVGSDDDVSSIPAFCNQGAVIAGSARRVREIDPLDPNAPEIGTMRQFAERVYARPYVDSSVTQAALGWRPTPRPDAIAHTVDWLRGHGLLGPAGRA